MSDETKCRVCGDSGWMPSELGGSVPCGCAAPRMFLGGVFVSTPPTPDPRERGEEDAIRAEFGWKRDPRPLIECIRERVNAGDDARDALRAPARVERGERERLAALAVKHIKQFDSSALTALAECYTAQRAPAPSEAVAWVTKEGSVIHWEPLFPSKSACVDYAARYGQGRALTPLPLYTHPAPARGVTVTEAMVQRAARFDFDSRHGRGLWGDPDWMNEREWTLQHARNLLTAALTPDAP